MDYTQFFRFVKFQGRTDGRIAVRAAGACTGKVKVRLRFEIYSVRSILKAFVMQNEILCGDAVPGCVSVKTAVYAGKGGKNV